MRGGHLGGQQQAKNECRLNPCSVAGNLLSIPRDLVKVSETGGKKVCEPNVSAAWKEGQNRRKSKPYTLQKQLDKSRMENQSDTASEPSEWWKGSALSGSQRVGSVGFQASV